MGFHLLVDLTVLADQVGSEGRARTVHEHRLVESDVRLASVQKSVANALFVARIAVECREGLCESFMVQNTAVLQGLERRTERLGCLGIDKAGNRLNGVDAVPYGLGIPATVHGLGSLPEMRGGSIHLCLPEGVYGLLDRFPLFLAPAGNEVEWWMRDVEAIRCSVMFEENVNLLSERSPGGVFVGDEFQEIENREETTV